VPRQSPPRIVHVIYALSTGGLENGLVNIINRMPPGRYEHVIVCITSADDFANRITADGTRVIELNKREGHDLGFYWRLWKLFRELRPDIIHSRNLAALETQLLSMGCPGVKRIHGEHGREVGDLDGTNWKYLAFRRCMRAFIYRYIPVSKDLECWLQNVVGVRPEMVRQIYNGVDHDRFSPHTVKPLALLPAHWRGVGDMLVIGTVGRLTPVKDQRTLLRAVARLCDSRPDLSGRLRLVIVGDGPLQRELQELVARLDLEAVAWLPGDRADVPALLALMDVFVLPSLAEGISNTMLEAMASGLPVIATAVGGNLELIEDGFNGSLVPVGDSQALTKALGLLLENDEERSRQAANARQRVCQRFDWKRTVDAYLAVYDEVMQLPADKQMESTK
jgi:sugar transferase (PEP-CTERM/EpsH1 system associated)